MSYSIRGLGFGYPGKEQLFTGFSLDLSSSETTLLSGENGCGKSSLLRLMSGLLKAQSGSISFRDRTISTDRSNPGIYYFPQNPLDGVIGISPREDFLIWQSALGGRLDTNAMQLLADQHTKLWEQPWFRMSSGQQRKFSLSILPYLQDAFWLLDEPFAGLDQDAIHDLLRVLRTKQDESETGMLIVSHDPELAKQLQARMIKLDDLK